MRSRTRPKSNLPFVICMKRDCDHFFLVVKKFELKLRIFTTLNPAMVARQFKKAVSSSFQNSCTVAITYSSSMHSNSQDKQSFLSTLFFMEKKMQRSLLNHQVFGLAKTVVLKKLQRLSISPNSRTFWRNSVRPFFDLRIWERTFFTWLKIPHSEQINSLSIAERKRQKESQKSHI